ncbi:bile acid:sodium symporter family protein [Nakamurella sp.]|uniref:bile acid:sodium symporter family protein n=1 Tax=Nakamurella sp. TaxID=1869182 RepID=UPI003782F2B2
MTSLLLALMPIMFTASIAVTVFSYGLRATNDDIMYVFRRPRLLVICLIAMFVVVPVIALALDVYFDFPYPARAGLVVLALTPISQLLPRTEIASGGRPSFAYGLSFVVYALSIAIVPAMANFLGRVMSRPFDLPPGTIAVTIATTVLVPLAVGMLTARLWPRLADRIGPPMLRIADIVLWVAILIALVALAPAIWRILDIRTLLAMIVFIAAALAVGHFLGGPDPDHSVVLAIACANRNPGMAIAIAATVFPAESFTATLVFYGIVIGFVTKPYVTWQQRRLAAATRPPQSDRGSDAR